MTALTLTLKYQSHHHHFPMNLPVPIHHTHSLPTQSQCLVHCPISWPKSLAHVLGHDDPLIPLCYHPLLFHLMVPYLSASSITDFYEKLKGSA